MRSIVITDVNKIRHKRFHGILHYSETFYTRIHTRYTIAPYWSSILFKYGIFAQFLYSIEAKWNYVGFSLLQLFFCRSFQFKVGSIKNYNFFPQKRLNRINGTRIVQSRCFTKSFDWIDGYFFASRFNFLWEKKESKKSGAKKMPPQNFIYKGYKSFCKEFLRIEGKCWKEKLATHQY